MKFTSVREKGSSYLPNTYVNVGGTVYFVNDELNMLDCEGDRVQVTDKNIAMMDFKSPTLGYMKVGDGFLYVRRTPMRNFKTGVNPRNVDPSYALNHISVAETLRSLQNIQDGIYPSYEECKNSRHTTAFSRCYAAKANDIFYCGTKIGSLKRDTIKFDAKLKRDFHESYLLSIIGNVNFVFEEYKYVNPEEEDV